MPLTPVNLSTGPDTAGGDNAYVAFGRVNAGIAALNLIGPATVGGTAGLIGLSLDSAFALDATGSLGVVTSNAGALLPTDIVLLSRAGILRSTTVIALARALVAYLPRANGGVLP